jgi:hypothetical protein
MTQADHEKMMLWLNKKNSVRVGRFVKKHRRKTEMFVLCRLPSDCFKLLQIIEFQVLHISLQWKKPQTKGKDYISETI